MVCRTLAVGIVVKENRVRYQKEQFDRMCVSLTQATLTSDRLTLREFAANYADLIDVMCDSSHNWVCPKIDANYDHYDAMRVQPVNATIFYYFFSASKMGRTWAQMILASGRYPNEKIRRAYTRFFQ